MKSPFEMTREQKIRALVDTIESGAKCDRARARIKLFELLEVEEWDHRLQATARECS